ncbi:MAG: FGGY family carbohydrate kinase [Elusimicrobiota bacterium]|jgi:glycerol kinase
MDHVLALDQGSSSTRVVAFDESGSSTALSQRPLRTLRPAPGFVEHDPEELARGAEEALDTVLTTFPAAAGVAALGLSAQRSTVVFWDARTGKAAGRAPSWQDGRAADMLVPLQDRQRETHERTGLYLTPYYSASKIRWMLDNDPDVRRLAEAGTLRIGPVTSWLLWRLSGGTVFAADPTTAQRTLLLDLRTMDWDPELLKLFGVPREFLPAVRPTTGELCVLERGGRRIPVLAALGDQQAAAVGQGASAEGAGVLNYGTGAFFLLHTGAKAHRVPGILTSVALQKKSGAPQFFLEGTVHAAGTAYEWLKRNFGLLSDVREADRLCRESTERIWSLQAIGGLGAPRWDYKTPTVLLGLSARTKPADVVRGATEAIAFLIADCVAAVRAAGLEPRTLNASGGVARNDYLLQFQADILQKPVSRLKEGEATALGAAYLAAEEAGLPWAGKLLESGVDREFKPRMSADDAKRLSQAWTLFVETQQKLGEDLRRLGVLS